MYRIFNLIYVDHDSINATYTNLINYLTVENKFNGIVINFKYPSIVDRQALASRGADTEKIHFIDGVTLFAEEMPNDESIYSLFNLEDMKGILNGVDVLIKKDPQIKFLVIDIIDALQFYNSIKKINDLMIDMKKICQENGIIGCILINKENQTLLEGIESLFDNKILNVSEIKLGQEQDSNIKITSTPEKQEYEEIKLEPIEIDGLKEMGNIGAGNASTKLSSVLKERIEMSLTSLDIFKTEEFFSKYQNMEGERMLCIFFRVTGFVTGSIVAMFKRDDALKIVDIMNKKELGATKIINEECKTTLINVGSEITNSYISSLSEFLNLDLGSEEPIFAVNKKNIVLTFMLRLIAFNLNKEVLMINTSFNIEKYKLKGEYLLLFGLSSLKELKEIIHKKLGF